MSRSCNKQGLYGSMSLRLGHPLPLAPKCNYSGVCIDDKVSLQLFPTAVPEEVPQEVAAGRDLEACAQAESAYTQVGLETHPKKSVRKASCFEVWGAHFLGDSGLLSMDCTKLVALSLTTACRAASGKTAERLLQKILGLWAFAFQFRRALFCLLSEANRVGHPLGDPLEP